MENVCLAKRFILGALSPDLRRASQSCSPCLLTQSTWQTPRSAVSCRQEKHQGVAQAPSLGQKTRVQAPPVAFTSWGMVGKPCLPPSPRPRHLSVLICPPYLRGGWISSCTYASESPEGCSNRLPGPAPAFLTQWVWGGARVPRDAHALVRNCIEDHGLGRTVPR